MNNFHYRNPQNNLNTNKSSNLMEELEMINRQLEEDHKKLAEKRKL